MASKTTIELAVQMTCNRCETDIRNALATKPDAQIEQIDVGQEKVVLSTTLPSSDVIDLIESTGRRAVLIGQGSASLTHQGAAVAQILTGMARGVVRFTQVNQNTCVIEGTVDNLAEGRHDIAVHEFGDISEGCESCGDCFNPSGNVPAVGELGSFVASSNGRMAFRRENGALKVWDIIGRSLVVKDMEGKGVGCAVIARSAGLFENAKKMCTCDGISIWDERDVPVVGPGRNVDG